MVYNTPSGWKVLYANRRVETEIERLADDIRAEMRRVVDMIQNYGLEQVHAPYVKHIRDKIWEIRARGRDGIARSLYITAAGKRVYILHAFVKKTQATPHDAIELAVKRAKEAGLL
jgi:phage-related protein